MEEKDPLHIRTRERWLRIKDWMAGHKLLTAIFALTLYIIVSSALKEEPAAPQPEPATPLVTETLPGAEKPEPKGERLHTNMTNEQTIQYWQFFNQAMNIGQPDTVQDFEGAKFILRIVATAPAQTESGTCRGFSEQLSHNTVLGTYRGIACRLPSGDWCRKYEGESKPLCRTTPPGGLEGFMLDSDISLHNLGMSINRGLYNWGF